MATRKKPAAKKPAPKKQVHKAEDIFGDDDLKESYVQGLIARRQMLFNNLQQRLEMAEKAKNEVLMLRGMMQEVGEQLKTLGHEDPPQAGQPNAG